MMKMMSLYEIHVRFSNNSFIYHNDYVLRIRKNTKLLKPGTCLIESRLHSHEIIYNNLIYSFKITDSFIVNSLRLCLIGGNINMHDRDIQ